MKILIFPLDAVGHTNPMLALASKLLQKGHHVRFILQSERLEEPIRKLPFTNYDIREVLQYEKGTVFDNEFIYSKIPPYEEQHETDRKLTDFLLLGMTEGFKAFPSLFAAAEEYNPDLIISDPVPANPFIIAHKLNVPCVSLMTLPSFNHYVLFCGKHTDEEKEQAVDNLKASQIVKKCRDLYKENYQFDLFKDAVPGNYYLRRGLTICTGVKEFELPMPEAIKPVYQGMDKDCKYVGPMLLSEKEGRISTLSDGSPPCEHQWIDEPFPMDELRKYKEYGRKIIYFSLGTCAPSTWAWDFDCPDIQAKMLGACSSGKDFCRGLWQRAFEAFGDKKGYVVVMASQSQQPDSLEGFEIPSNFIIRRKCPQLEILKLADAFITHGGFNSTLESIAAHVPMLVLPYFADQFDNAKMVSKEGMGLHYNDPLAECTSIGEDVDKLLKFEHFFKNNCKRVAGKLEKAGGAEEATNHIEDYVKSFTGHEMLRSASKSKHHEGYFERCNTGSFRANNSGSLKAWVGEGSGSFKFLEGV
jgi:UDP:flavonoid glycosyltransferase YjiC (YdhE family)